MQTITQSFSLLWNAMFLDSRAYAAMGDDESPVKKGLIILIILGLALGLAGFIGGTLEWASKPSVEAIKDTVYELNRQSPWWQFVEQQPETLEVFNQVWDQVWQIVQSVSPTPTSSLSGFIARPVGLVLSWLIFGLVIHIYARLFGGTAALGQTLGATALASAPQLLGLITAVPFAVVAGIGVWTFLCRYMAVRVVHDLSWARSLWTVVLTFLTFLFLIFILGLIGGFVLGTILAATFDGGL